MAGMLRMRRSRGALSGFLLALLGLWGALIPFIGPYFRYAYTPDVAWTYTTARLWLEILPGAAVFFGGVLLIVATGRHVALFGSVLAAAAGAWFTLGTTLSPLWNNHVTLGGSPASSAVSSRVKHAASAARSTADRAASASITARSSSGGRTLPSGSRCSSPSSGGPGSSRLAASNASHSPGVIGSGRVITGSQGPGSGCAPEGGTPRPGFAGDGP